MSSHHKGVLYLIPAPLGDNGLHAVGTYFKETVFGLNHFIVEHEKTARRYLKLLGYPHSLNDLRLYVLNEHSNTKQEALWEITAPLRQGISMGLLSEAGCPAIADPGSAVVALCHDLNIKVVPFVGPSSIILSLMASGMNGQNFAFLGYLPAKTDERKNALRQLEQHAVRTGQTQIFIETPYRNNQLLKDIVSVCNKNTRLCIAVDLTLPSEFIQTQPIYRWQNMLPDINKKPAVFLIGL
jgi:16S rRNA (cytidine1402-2'-O)-methyltransferase